MTKAASNGLKVAEFSIAGTIDEQPANKAVKGSVRPKIGHDRRMTKSDDQQQKKVMMMKKYVLSTIALVAASSVSAATMSNINLMSQSGYKDSFTFGYSGKHYMAVSNGGHLRILKGDSSGNADTYNSNTVFCDININDSWAPQVFMIGNTARIYYSTFNTGLKTYYADLNMSNTNASGQCASAPTSGNLVLTGVYDPTIWQEGSYYYIAGAACTNGSSSSCIRTVNSRNVWDSYLVWSSSTSLTSGWSTPQALLDGSYNKVDKGRDQDIGYLVEAPIWSYWDHPNSVSGATDGHHELYWSIGPSDPYLSGSCNPDVKAVRRGDIWYRSGSGAPVPYIKIWGPSGGGDDLMSNNMDCYHATHPDFQANGDLRITTMSSSLFYIGNYTSAYGPGGYYLRW